MMNTDILRKLVVIVFSFALTGLLFGQAGGNTGLTGSGATFPEPLYKKMFDVYNKTTRVKVNYQGIGSGGGIKQLSDKVTDFGGTDAFMTDTEMKSAGAAIVHIPTCLGSVVVVYNLPGVKSGLRFGPDAISAIFLGKITNWNDPLVAATNPGLKLPDLNISVVHRSDGSGTSFVFTDYLAKASKEWKEKVGADKAPAWPTGIGGKGNPGVADLVSKIPGSIGYVELVYAASNNISFADVRNKSGNYITPSLKSTSLAADITLPDDTRITITDTDAKEGYPVSSFTWIVLYKEQKYNNRTLAAAESLVNMLWWLIHDGQAYNEGLSYGPLAKSVVEKAERILESVTYDGRTILK